MKQKQILFIVIGLVFLGVMFVVTERVNALPEYSAQTGEPCASCHISPSGGGARTPRGQAWVGSKRPAEVPSLMASLELLGVHLTVDESLYLRIAGESAPAEPLIVDPGASGVREWVEGYGGN